MEHLIACGQATGADVERLEVFVAKQKARVLKIRAAKAAATAAAAAARAQAAAAAGQGTAQVRMGPNKSEVQVPGIVSNPQRASVRAAMRSTGLAHKRGAGLGPRRQLSLPAYERPWQKIG